MSKFAFFRSGTGELELICEAESQSDAVRAYEAEHGFGGEGITIAAVTDAQAARLEEITSDGSYCCAIEVIAPADRIVFDGAEISGILNA